MTLRLNDERFTVKEHMTMSENLGDALSQILLNHTRGLTFNYRVNFGLAKATALVKNRLRREQVRFVDLSNSGKLDEAEKEERLVRIMEFEEEYENLRFRTFASSLIDDNIDSKKWRCIFRTIGKREINMTVLDFVGIYNKWTAASADYLILKALRDLECGEEGKRSRNQIVLAKEYEEKVRKKEELLEAYLQDLHDIATELEEECGIFELLEDVEAVEAVEDVEDVGAAEDKLVRVLGRAAQRQRKLKTRKKFF